MGAHKHDSSPSPERLQARARARRFWLIFLGVGLALGVLLLVIPGDWSADPAELVGRWRRTDGDYVLHVKSVTAQGGTVTLDAEYLNPRPIHVAEARAVRKAGSWEVFVKLEDVNYPGSTYTLGYDPWKRKLAGTYFQAAEGQSFEVEFDRE